MKLNVLLFSNYIDDPTNLPDISPYYNYILMNSGDSATDFSSLSAILRKYHFVAICVIGKSNYDLFDKLPHEYFKKIIFAESLENLSSSQIEEIAINNMLHINKGDESKNNLLFSVITTTFHSGKKIYRPYESLKSQTYNNWEWVIWDDSSNYDSELWNTLLEFQEKDIRINCYKGPVHSGFIGDMKWKASSLCKGDYIVELDHDDIIHPDLFKWCYEAIQKYPDSDFLYSNCIELYEENEDPFNYGEYYGLGYGAYQKEFIRNKWHNVSLAPHINSRTLKHIVGVPNHVRIWKKEFYDKIGRHNYEMPVVDDYELLLRSVIAGKWTHIQGAGYYQYRNAGGNNFTFLRNGLIQYLTSKTHSYYDKLLTEFFNRPDMKQYTATHAPCKAWELKEGYSHDKMYNIYVPYTQNNCISIIIIVNDENEEDIIETILSVLNQSTDNYLLYVVGNKSKTLNAAINKLTELYIHTEKEYDDRNNFKENNFKENIIKRLKWWNLKEGESGEKEYQNCLNYAHRMMVNTEWITYLNVGNKWEKEFLSNIQNSGKLYSESYFNVQNSFFHNTKILKNFNEFNLSSFQNSMA